MLILPLRLGQTTVELLLRRAVLQAGTCYRPCSSRVGAMQIGSKHAFLIKLKNGLTSSRV